MSIAEPAVKDGFAYTIDSFFAEASNKSRHRRATVQEIQALFRPPSQKSREPVKEPVGHWYEAQLLHYGLPPSKNKAVAKTRLLDAVNKGSLAVPERILKLETELKKEWNKNDKLSKKLIQSADSDLANSHTGSKKTKGTPAKALTAATPKAKVKPAAAASKTASGAGKPKQAASTKAAQATASKAKQPGAKAAPQRKRKAADEGDAGAKRPATAARRGGSTARGAHARGTTRGGSGSARTATVHQSVSTSNNNAAPATRPSQMARRSRGNWHGGSSRSADTSDRSAVAYEDDYGGYNDDTSETDDVEFKREASPQDLLPLGLINGTYEIDCEDLDQWEQFQDYEMSLTLRLEGTAVWGAYDFGMYSGILYMAERPWRSSYEAVPFKWRGRENSEGTMSFGSSNKGWIRFLGNGKIEGIINCYGNANFSGTWNGGHTSAARDVRSMRSEWDEYNEEEYERERRARWGGSGW